MKTTLNPKSRELVETAFAYAIEYGRPGRTLESSPSQVSLIKYILALENRVRRLTADNKHIVKMAKELNRLSR